MNDDNNALPAYLRNRNGRLELVLHCTWVQDYDICAHKFWLRYGEQVEGTGPRAALNYGGAVHEALRLRYTQTALPLDEIERVQFDALDGWFEASPNPVDDYRNAQRAKDLIAAYNAEYPSHDWQVLAVEEEFEVEVGKLNMILGDTTYAANLPVYLAGRKDLVVAWHDGVWVVDHKTAQDWGKGDSNSHLDEGRMSFQFRGYAWAEREAQRKLAIDAALQFSHPPDSTKLRATLPVLGTVGNYLVSRRPYAKISIKAEPRNVFHQEAYPFSPTTLDEWRDECLGVAAEILRSHAAGVFRRKRSGCGHWGRCEFYDYCEAKPEDRAGLLASTLFQPKTIERDL